MEPNRRNIAPLFGGMVLIAIGGIALAAQFFQGANFWGALWPLIIVGFGAMFFAGMFAGGRPASALAIPGSIITVVGLMLLLQNTFDYFQSWSYGWTVIVISVGLGIFIMGWFGEEEGQRAAGISVMKVGAILLLVFGVFFESIFNTWGFSRLLFPLALIALGAYLIFARAGLLPRRKSGDGE